MERSNLDLFAKNYPRPQAPRGPGPSMRLPQQGPPKESMRTPLEAVVSPTTEAYSSKTQIISPAASRGSKKLLAILLITMMAAFIFSAFSYTITDSLFGKMGLEFFSESGAPGAVIIAIHSLILLGLIYLILSVIRWC